MSWNCLICSQLITRNDKVHTRPCCQVLVHELCMSEYVAYVTSMGDNEATCPVCKLVAEDLELPLLGRLQNTATTLAAENRLPRTMLDDDDDIADFDDKRSVEQLLSGRSFSSQSSNARQTPRSFRSLSGVGTVVSETVSHEGNSVDSIARTNLAVRAESAPGGDIDVASDVMIRELQWKLQEMDGVREKLESTIKIQKAGAEQIEALQRERRTDATMIEQLEQQVEMLKGTLRSQASVRNEKVDREDSLAKQLQKLKDLSAEDTAKHRSDFETVQKQYLESKQEIETLRSQLRQAIDASSSDSNAAAEHASKLDLVSRQLVDARMGLEESERLLDIGRENELKLEQKLKQLRDEFDVRLRDAVADAQRSVGKQTVLEQELASRKSALADLEGQVTELRHAKVLSDRTIAQLKLERDSLAQGMNSSEATAVELSKKREEVNLLRHELNRCRDELEKGERSVYEERNHHASKIAQLQNSYESTIQQYKQDNEQLMSKLNAVLEDRQPGELNNLKVSVRDDPTFKQLESNFRALAMHAKELQKSEIALKEKLSHASAPSQTTVSVYQARIEQLEGFVNSFRQSHLFKTLNSFKEDIAVHREQTSRIMIEQKSFSLHAVRQSVSKAVQEGKLRMKQQEQKFAIVLERARADISRMKEALNQANSKLQHQDADRDEQVAEIAERMVELERELEQSQARSHAILAKAEAEKEKTQRDHDEVAVELKNLRVAYENALEREQEFVQKLESTKDERDSAVAQLHFEIEEKREEISRVAVLEAQARADEALQNLRAAHEEQLKELRDQFAALKEATFEEAYTRGKDDSETFMQQQLDELRESMVSSAKAEAEATSMKMDADREEQLKHVRDQLSALNEASLAQAESRFQNQLETALCKKEELIAEHVNELKQELAAKDSALASLSEELENSMDTTAKLKKLEEDAFSYQSQLAQSDAIIIHLREQIDTITTQNKHVVDELTTSLDEASSKVSAMADEHREHLEAALLAVRGETDDMRSTIATLEADKADLHEKVRSLDDAARIALDESQERVNSLREEYIRLKDELQAEVDSTNFELDETKTRIAELVSSNVRSSEQAEKWKATADAMNDLLQDALIRLEDRSSQVNGLSECLSSLDDRLAGVTRRLNEAHTSLQRERALRVESESQSRQLVAMLVELKRRDGNDAEQLRVRVEGILDALKEVEADNANLKKMFADSMEKLRDVSARARLYEKEIDKRDEKIDFIEANMEAFQLRIANLQEAHARLLDQYLISLPTAMKPCEDLPGGAATKEQVKALEEDVNMLQEALVNIQKFNDESTRNLEVQLDDMRVQVQTSLANAADLERELVEARGKLDLMKVHEEDLKTLRVKLENAEADLLSKNLNIGRLLEEAREEAEREHHSELTQLNSQLDAVIEQGSMKLNEALARQKELELELVQLRGAQRSRLRTRPDHPRRLYASRSPSPIAVASALEELTMQVESELGEATEAVAEIEATLFSELGEQPTHSSNSSVSAVSPERRLRSSGAPSSSRSRKQSRSRSSSPLSQARSLAPTPVSRSRSPVPTPVSRSPSRSPAPSPLVRPLALRAAAEPRRGPPIRPRLSIATRRGIASVRHRSVVAPPSRQPRPPPVELEESLRPRSLSEIAHSHGASDPIHLVDSPLRSQSTPSNANVDEVAPEEAPPLDQSILLPSHPSVMPRSPASLVARRGAMNQSPRHPSLQVSNRLPTLEVDNESSKDQDDALASASSSISSARGLHREGSPTISKSTDEDIHGHAPREPAIYVPPAHRPAGRPLRRGPPVRRGPTSRARPTVVGPGRSAPQPPAHESQSPSSSMLNIRQENDAANRTGDIVNKSNNESEEKLAPRSPARSFIRRSGQPTQRLSNPRAPPPSVEPKLIVRDAMPEDQIQPVDLVGEVSSVNADVDSVNRDNDGSNADTSLVDAWALDDENNVPRTLARSIVPRVVPTATRLRPGLAPRRAAAPPPHPVTSDASKSDLIPEDSIARPLGAVDEPFSGKVDDRATSEATSIVKDSNDDFKKPSAPLQPPTRAVMRRIAPSTRRVRPGQSAHRTLPPPQLIASPRASSDEDDRSASQDQVCGISTEDSKKPDAPSQPPSRAIMRRIASSTRLLRPGQSCSSLPPQVHKTSQPFVSSTSKDPQPTDHIPQDANSSLQQSKSQSNSGHSSPRGSDVASPSQSTSPRSRSPSMRRGPRRSRIPRLAPPRLAPRPADERQSDASEMSRSRSSSRRGSTRGRPRAQSPHQSTERDQFLPKPDKPSLINRVLGRASISSTQKLEYVCDPATGQWVLKTETASMVQEQIRESDDNLELPAEDDRGALVNSKTGEDGLVSDVMRLRNQLGETKREIQKAREKASTGVRRLSDAIETVPRSVLLRERMERQQEKQDLLLRVGRLQQRLRVTKALLDEAHQRVSALETTRDSKELQLLLERVREELEKSEDDEADDAHEHVEQAALHLDTLRAVVERAEQYERTLMNAQLDERDSHQIMDANSKSPRIACNRVFIASMAMLIMVLVVMGLFWPDLQEQSAVSILEPVIDELIAPFEPAIEHEL